MHSIEFFCAVFIGLHGFCGGEWCAVGIIVGAFYHCTILAHYAANVALIVFCVAVNGIVFDVTRRGQNAVYNAIMENIVATVVHLQRLAACCIIICCANLCTIGCVDIFYLPAIGE